MTIFQTRIGLYLVILLVAIAPSIGGKTFPPPFSFAVQKVAPNTVSVTIVPAYPFPGRIFSLAVMHADEKVTFPLPENPSEEEKDRSMLVTFEETSTGMLTTPFYKMGIFDAPKKGFENPFAKIPITDLQGNPVGSKATGILYFMARRMKGIVKTPSGSGKIPWEEGKGFSFLLHFNTKIPQWKILLGIVHIDLINPSLDYPVLSPVFSIL